MTRKGLAVVARDVGLFRARMYTALSGESSTDSGAILRAMTAPGLKLPAEASQV